MIITLPIKTVSEANVRCHHMVRAKRTKANRRAAWMLSRAYPVPCVVTLVRVSPGTLDSDNLRSALKAVRDGIADRLCVDDGGDLVRWEYRQEKGPACVRVEFGPMDEQERAA